MAFPNATRGQGATEYLVLLAVVLIIALVSIALLGFFPGLATDAKVTQSASYWKGEARPFAILETSLMNSSTGAILLQNVDASGSYMITGVTLALSNSPSSFIVNTTNLTVGPGATQRVNFASTTAITGTGAGSGSVYELDVTINYTSPNGIVSRQIGSKPLIGKFS